ncbi:MAG: matrixin family metalloprotease [Marmoricola sp.]
MPFFDRLDLGAARRRRRMDRQLRDLEHWDERDWPTPRPQRIPRRPRISSARTSPARSLERLRSGFVVAVTGLSAVAAVAVFAPTLLPSPVAQALGVQRSPLGKPPDVNGSGSYKFLATRRGSASPVAYDACRKIHVVYNPQDEPRGGESLVREAIDVIGKATGLELVYDGTTEDRPRWSGSSRPQGLGGADPVLVAFADEQEVSELAGRVAGVGGSVQVTDQFGKERYVTGQVTLDSDAFARMDRQMDGREQQLAIVLHEFGHLVGLDHVKDRNELMYAENVGQHQFGNGDRIGLARLGRGECF